MIFDDISLKQVFSATLVVETLDKHSKNLYNFSKSSCKIISVYKEIRNTSVSISIFVLNIYLSLILFLIFFWFFSINYAIFKCLFESLYRGTF